MPGQTAADLRSLVIRRAGKGRRVALLGSDPALVKGLEANGCTVLADPADPNALATLAPEVLVAFDGLLEPGDGAVFRTLALAAPGADLLLSFANAGSASALIRCLVGEPAARGQSAAALERQLKEAGYTVTDRDVVVVPFEPSGLAADAEAALRALLEQVNPQAAADRWLWVARRGVGAPVVHKAPGLLSAVVPEGEGHRTTVASLERQSYRPTETVANIEQATGQYLALLRPGDTVTRDHYSRLVAALARSTSAWALEAPVSAADCLRAGAVACCSYVIDRERIGPFAVSIPDQAPAAEAVLFARLLAVFPPVLVPSGPSYERTAAAPPVKDALAAMQARPLRMLVTLDELLEEPPEPELASLLRKRLQKLVR